MEISSWLPYFQLLACLAPSTVGVLNARRSYIMDYPYLVHIIGCNPFREWYRFAGVVIHNNLVVTTATECADSLMNRLYITAYSSIVYKYKITSRVITGFAHPDWSEEPFVKERNNICILVLNTTLPYSSKYQRAALPYQGEALPEPQSGNVTIAGWGRWESWKNLDEELVYYPHNGILHGRTFPILGGMGKEYPELFKVGIVPSKPKDEEGDIGKAAKGDEGAPVFHRASGKVIGIVQKTKPAPQWDKYVKPFVCIHLAPYRNWIESIRRVYGIAPDIKGH